MFTNPGEGGPTYKTQIDGLSTTKEAIITEIEHYKSLIDDVQSRFEETAQTKSLEMDWTTLKEEVNNLYLSIFELQTNIGGLEDQIGLSK
ncbi:thread biopolymer filament subunit alpha-like [Salvelinus alpinus]